ncbi:ExbD/TolR family protein [Carboxylicivirga linearis]|uniref:Biopolymer transporter ExbD n=1 Tax=Carboxylicivirga linearis TaxID=1628157 RepID=A0ABS5JZG7_9BACT|nr:biopolymer transporter ExbD [Carboxylicivirga linearis]MBS2100251.1 biopolymer transporter ExbD [Carboxylicivirga linearis]
MALKRRTKISASFSMSSMTDIVFLLLIFFMITSTMVHPNAIKLLIPRKSTKKVVVEKYVNVRITASSRFVVDGKWMGSDKVENSLLNIFTRNDKTIIKLRTDANASTGDAARVLDIAESNGVKVILDIR